MPYALGEIALEIESIRHEWPEKAGFCISRPLGIKKYTFLHFYNSVDILSDGKVIKTRPGACIFYSPDEPQWFRSDSQLVHNWMHTDYELHERLIRLDIPENRVIYPAQADFITEIFRRIEAEFFSSEKYRDEIMNSYVDEFLIKLSRAVNSGGTGVRVSSDERERLNAARREIVSSSERSWSVAEMAELVHLSTSRFYAVYKAVFGTSPMKDVIEARIRNAENMLMISDEAVSEISEKLGYSNQYHFIRQFRGIVGETPDSYRRSRKKQ